MLDTKKQQKLQTIEKELAERAGKALGSLLGVPTNITFESVEAFDFGLFQQLFDQQALRFETGWDGVEKGILLVGQVEAMSALTDLLLGEQGASNLLEGEGLSDLTELFEHVIGDEVDYYKAELNKEVEFGPSKIEPWDLSTPDPVFENYFIVTLSMKIEGSVDTTILKLVHPDTIEVAEQPQETASVRPSIEKATFNELRPIENKENNSRSIDMLMDLELPITVELGRIKMQVKDILELGPGRIVELNKFSGEPVDLLVNRKKFAEGEVVVIDQNFGIRLTALISPEERAYSMHAN